MIGFFTGLFAIVGLFLVLLGLYGISAYLTRRRTPEIAMWVALGARPSDIFRLILSQTMSLTAIGLTLASIFATAFVTRVLPQPGGP